MPTVKSTEAFIEKAFGEQLDQSGLPKWLHSLEVMKILPDHVSDDVRMAALLHDVIEDTAITYQDLQKAGYSATTLEIVALLSHQKEDISYFKYIKNVIEDGLFSKPAKHGALLVKYADICHNTSPERLDPKLGEKTLEHYRTKHSIPKDMLRNAIVALGYEDFDPYKKSAGHQR